MSTLTLCFCADGTAVLYEDEEPVWSSDDDEDFPEEMARSNLDVEDATRILTYLVEADIITENESQLCSVEEEDEKPDVIDVPFEEVSTSAKPS